jgi:hypothetical protein
MCGELVLRGQYNICVFLYVSALSGHSKKFAFDRLEGKSFVYSGSIYLPVLSDRQSLRYLWGGGGIPPPAASTPPLDFDYSVCKLETSLTFVYITGIHCYKQRPLKFEFFTVGCLWELKTPRAPQSLSRCPTCKETFLITKDPGRHLLHVIT